MDFRYDNPAMIQRIIILILLVLTSAGCERIYGVLHRPSAEERNILGEYVFSEYNARVEELQKILKLFGYPGTRADGKFGPATREAVASFQQDEGLEVTRVVDKATWARMQSYVNSPLVHDLELNVAGLQRAIKKAGFFSARLDGRMGPQTRGALKSFQRAQDLKMDGLVGIQTIRALMPYLEEKGP